MDKDENKKLMYEDCSDIVDLEIYKRKNKWRLTTIAWMDYEDVSQVLRSHIAQKWNQWDQARPLLPWINKIITNQIKNLLRNNYQNFVKPCTSCPFNNSVGERDNACEITPTKHQDSNCPLYKKWEKSKKHACGIKMPISMSDLPREELDAPQGSCIDLDFYLNKVKVLLKEVLPEKQYKIYEMLFHESLSEEEIAILLGYKTSEKGRKAGYKQIKNLKVKYKKIVINLLKKKDIF